MREALLEVRERGGDGDSNYEKIEDRGNLGTWCPTSLLHLVNRTSYLAALGLNHINEKPGRL